jgi:hypothetical protein
MTKKDKIAFIKSSKRKSHVYNDLQRYSDQQLNDLIREIVQGLVQGERDHRQRLHQRLSVRHEQGSACVRLE